MHHFLSILATAAITQSALAQCNPTWQATSLPPTVGEFYVAAVTSNGELVVGGAFETASGSGGILTTTNGSWGALGAGLSQGTPAVPGVVTAMVTLPNGELIVGGRFDSSGGTPIRNVARWDGSNWQALGVGVGTGLFFEGVEALAVMPNADIIAGGRLYSAGGSPASGIARWDGSSWSALGGGFTGSVESLLVMPNGDLIVGGVFIFLVNGTFIANVARWDGVQWSSVGGLGLSGGASDLMLLDNGDILAAASIANVVAGAPPSRIARWDGSSWSTLGAGLSGGAVRTLHALPNGDLLVGGGFTSVADRVARWDGSSWSPVDGGFSTFADQIYDLTSLPNGEVIAVGNFDNAGSVAATDIARLLSNCPATAQAYGAGCSGSNGPLALTATGLPFAGSTHTSEAAGLPLSSLALHVLGLSATALPLAAILPSGVAGCDLLATSDSLELLLPVAGTATASLSVPNTATLAGVSIYQQVVAIEVDAQLSFLAVVSTNGLQLTIGVF